MNIKTQKLLEFKSTFVKLLNKKNRNKTNMAKTSANLEEKRKALEAAMLKINKQFGAGSLQRLGDTNYLDVETVSTGSIFIDKALGVGGLPFGRIVEIFGPESSGKTTLTLHTIAEAQKMGKICAFIDAEHALDPVRARALGVDTDSLLISQPDSGEQALEICDTLASSGAVDVIVVDSVAALTPKAELEGDMGDSHMGLQARLLSQGLRKLVAKTKENNVLLIFINQLRMKIGLSFGNPETTTGGNALKFYSSVRIDIRRTGSDKKGDEIVANKVKIKIVKNKLAPPFKEAETTLDFKKGFDVEREILQAAVQYDLIKKAGAWYSDTSDPNFPVKEQGEDRMLQFLENNPTYFEKIKEKVISLIKVTDGKPENNEEDFDEEDFQEE